MFVLLPYQTAGDRIESGIGTLNESGCPHGQRAGTLA
jgi:hypothetical protein